MLIYGIVILLAGLFSIVCAAFDFDWFMNNRRASLFVKLFKRNGARVFLYSIRNSIMHYGSSDHIVEHKRRNPTPASTL